LIVELFPRAEADIIRQFRYYLVDKGDPVTAIRFREAVRKSLDRLEQYPRIGSLCRGSIRGLRSWPVNGFEIIRVYYVESTDRLRVVRILHGSRNVWRILRSEKLGQD
jgi:toxin ParE1/3/4